jgi:hypothetical protein
MDAWDFDTDARTARRHRTVGVVVGTLLTAAAMSVVGVGATSPAPATQFLPGEPNAPWADGAIPATSRNDLLQVRPRTWEHVLLASDGRTATVYFTMGADACEGLAGIQVRPADSGVRLLVLTGDVPDAPEECPAVSQLYRAEVVLDDRVVSGGELLDLPAGSAPTA